MTAVLLVLIAGANVSPVLNFVAWLRGDQGKAVSWSGIAALSNGALALVAAADGCWPGVILCGAAAVFWAWGWWKNRGKRRRKALAVLGAKSRALRDALVANMPRPQPQGEPGVTTVMSHVLASGVQVLIGMAAGWFLARYARRLSGHGQPQPVCGCQHHYSMHHPAAGDRG
jgi:hypothetical protein